MTETFPDSMALEDPTDSIHEFLLQKLKDDALSFDDFGQIMIAGAGVLKQGAKKWKSSDPALIPVGRQAALVMTKKLADLRPELASEFAAWEKEHRHR